MLRLGAWVSRYMARRYPSCVGAQTTVAREKMTMARSDGERRRISRRESPESPGLMTRALSAGTLAGTPTMATVAQSAAEAAGSAGGGPYDILFVLTDLGPDDAGTFKPPYPTKHGMRPTGAFYGAAKRPEP
jgi:hypothetical protein